MDNDIDFRDLFDNARAGTLFWMAEGVSQGSM